MRLRFTVASLLIGLLLLGSSTVPTEAATAHDKGLAISPLRNYLKVDAGGAKTGFFQVANLTSKPITVNLSVKQFSVTDYTYSYIFRDPKRNWIRLDETQVQLQPSKNQRITYSVAPPAGTAPGGQYFTLFASADLSSAGISGTVQAATLLYITVNGNVVQSGHTESSSIRRWNFGSEIPYGITVRNTGNIHYFVFTSGRLHGLSAKGQDQSATHLLMPDTARRMKGSIDSPVLPGVYKADYGYTTDSGTAGMRSEYILFTPPWSIAALLLVIIGIRTLMRHRKLSIRRRNSSVDD